MNTKYLLQKIYEAYRKFKNYSYYDSASLLSRMRVSEFEEDLYDLKEKQFKKNMVIVKGGKNSTILIDDLDIDALRKFQLPGYAGQNVKGIFKNTPPRFNQKDVKTRIDDNDFK